jgi:hypothetical protein
MGTLMSNEKNNDGREKLKENKTNINLTSNITRDSVLTTKNSKNILNKSII